MNKDVIAFNLVVLAIDVATAPSKRPTGMENRHRKALAIVEELIRTIEDYGPCLSTEKLIDTAKYLQQRCAQCGLDNQSVAPDLIAHLMCVSANVEGCIAFAKILAPDEQTRRRAFKYLWEQLSIDLGLLESQLPDGIREENDIKPLFGAARFAFYREIHDQLGLTMGEQFDKHALPLQARANLLDVLTKVANRLPARVPFTDFFFSRANTEAFRLIMRIRLSNIKMGLYDLHPILQGEQTQLGYIACIHDELWRIFVLTL